MPGVWRRQCIPEQGRHLSRCRLCFVSAHTCETTRQPEQWVNVVQHNGIASALTTAMVSRGFSWIKAFFARFKCKAHLSLQLNARITFGEPEAVKSDPSRRSNKEHRGGKKRKRNTKANLPKNK